MTVQMPFHLYTPEAYSPSQRATVPSLALFVPLNPQPTPRERHSA
jgi:hypothetical protein